MIRVWRWDKQEWSVLYVSDHESIDDLVTELKRMGYNVSPSPVPPPPDKAPRAHVYHLELFNQHHSYFDVRAFQYIRPRIKRPVESVQDTPVESVQDKMESA